MQISVKHSFSTLVNVTAQRARGVAGEPPTEHRASGGRRLRGGRGPDRGLREATPRRSKRATAPADAGVLVGSVVALGRFGESVSCVLSNFLGRFWVKGLAWKSVVQHLFALVKTSPAV